MTTILPYSFTTYPFNAEDKAKWTSSWNALTYYVDLRFYLSTALRKNILVRYRFINSLGSLCGCVGTVVGVTSNQIYFVGIPNTGGAKPQFYRLNSDGITKLS